MTTNGRPVSEDDLHAYVDGLLDPERRRSVEQYLMAHAGIAARVAGWVAGRDLLRDAFAGEAGQPVPASLNLSRLAAARTRRHWAPMRAAAGMVLSLGLGAGAGWVAHGSGATGGIAALGVQAADAHRAFASDTVRPVEVGAADMARNIAWVGQRLGRAVVPPDLSAAGYRLMGARMLSTAQGPACLFMYDDDHGVRISVMMRPMLDPGMQAPMRAVEDHGTAGYAWARDGLGVSLVASAKLATLHDLSNTVRDEMARS
jgi:anti-sigma factor RsiW